jgi:hypothetical protein
MGGTEGGAVGEGRGEKRGVVDKVERGGEERGGMGGGV